MKKPPLLTRLYFAIGYIPGMVRAIQGTNKRLSLVDTDASQLDFSPLIRKAKADPSFRPFVGANFQKTHLGGQDFSQMDFSEANFQGAALQNTIFTSAVFKGANFHGANLTDADFEDANFYQDNPSASQTSLKAAILKGARLNRAQLQEVDLTSAILKKAKLWNAHLGKANLTGADLTEADCTKAFLVKASLREAKLINTLLIDTNASGADCRGADFKWSRLIKTILRGAKLQRADLTRVYCHEADFTDAEANAETRVGANLIEAAVLSQPFQKLVKPLALSKAAHHGMLTFSKTGQLQAEISPAPPAMEGDSLSNPPSQPLGLIVPSQRTLL